MNSDTKSSFPGRMIAYLFLTITIFPTATLSLCTSKMSKTPDVLQEYDHIIQEQLAAGMAAAGEGTRSGA